MPAAILSNSLASCGVLVVYPIEYLVGLALASATNSFIELAGS